MAPTVQRLAHCLHDEFAFGRWSATRHMKDGDALEQVRVVSERLARLDRLWRRRRVGALPGATAALRNSLQSSFDGIVARGVDGVGQATKRRLPDATGTAAVELKARRAHAAYQPPLGFARLTCCLVIKKERRWLALLKADQKAR